MMLLKLFDDICIECYSTIDTNINYRVPIHYIAYDYGLLDCYLDNKCLVIVFDKEIAISDLKKTKSKYYSFVDRLIDSDEFFKLETYHEDLLCIWLKIPDKYHNDLNIIRQSKYSKTSEDFKQMMNVSYTIINNEMKIPPFNHPIARYIVIKNIPARIVFRSKKLKQEIIEDFDINETSLEDVEYFIQWDDQKELWNPEFLKRYL